MYRFRNYSIDYVAVIPTYRTPADEPKGGFIQLAAYLANKKALEGLRNSLQRIHDAYYKLVEKQTTTDAIWTLQEAVQKLTKRVEAKPARTHAIGPLGTSYVPPAR